MDTLTAFGTEAEINGHHRATLLAFHFFFNIQPKIFCHLLYRLLNWLLDGLLHRLLDRLLDGCWSRSQACATIRATRKITYNGITAMWTTLWRL
jgi:hypothetical protein